MTTDIPPWTDEPGELTYDPESTATVFAFDRDKTVDVNPARGRTCVPLEWITYLAHETPHVVYAIGNQKLTVEAEIPGTLEIVGNHPRYEDRPTPDSLLDCPRTDRRGRLRMLADLYPDATEYVVIDDLDLGDVEGWTYYTGWDFVDTVREGSIASELPPE